MYEFAHGLPPANVMAAYKILRRDGVAGRPLYSVEPDGRVTMHLLFELPDDRAALAPITLFGENDLARFVHFAAEGERGSERTVFVGDGAFFSEERLQLPWAQYFDDSLAWLAACLLGLAGAELIESPLRRYIGDFQSLRTLADVDFSRIEFPDRDFWRTGPCGAQRAEIEVDLRTRFAYLDGAILSNWGEPTWRVSVADNGVINVEASPYDFVHLSDPATPVIMPFSAACEREANSFADYMATRVANGRIRRTREMSVFRPDLATFDRPAIGLHLDFLLKRVDRIAPMIGSASLGLLLAMQDRLKAGEPDDDDWDTVVAQWTAFSQSLDGGFAGTKVRDDLDKQGARWEHRFAIVRSALDYALGLVDVSQVVAQEEASPVAAAIDLDPARMAIKSMAELLVRGGVLYQQRWKDARDAIDAFEKAGTRESALIAWRTMSGLVETIPEAFPSAPSSSRWAMKHRPALKEVIARVAERFSFVEKDLQGE